MPRSKERLVMGKKMNAAIKNLEPRVYGLREAVEAV